MTGITPEGFEVDRDITAPPSAVFTALSTAEHFAHWFGGRDVQVPTDRLDYAPAVGRTWSATMALPDGGTIDWAGELLEIVPDEHFVFTLTDRPAEPGRAAVAVDLTPTSGGTHLHMTQTSPEFTTEQREATIVGWQTFFDELAVRAEA